jgi:hypothetical protein
MIAKALAIYLVDFDPFTRKNMKEHADSML